MQSLCPLQWLCTQVSVGGTGGVRHSAGAAKGSLGGHGLWGGQGCAVWPEDAPPRLQPPSERGEAPRSRPRSVRCLLTRALAFQPPLLLPAGDTPPSRWPIGRWPCPGLPDGRGWSRGWCTAACSCFLNLWPVSRVEPAACHRCWTGQHFLPVPISQRKPSLAS